MAFAIIYSFMLLIMSAATEEDVTICFGVNMKLLTSDNVKDLTTLRQSACLSCTTDNPLNADGTACGVKKLLQCPIWSGKEVNGKCP